MSEKLSFVHPTPNSPWGTYLQQVRQGSTLLITDRGQPVAEVRPIDHRASSRDARLAQLNAEGIVTRQHAQPLKPFRAIRATGRRTAARLIDEGREDRF